jgi:tetratricopeptide (TPR) repeat protein
VRGIRSEISCREDMGKTLATFAAAIFVFGVFSIALRCPCFAAEESPKAPAASAEEEIVARALEGQEAIFARRYADAERIFGKLISDFPKSPAGPFGMMARYEIQMLETEDFCLEKEFLEAAAEGQRRVRAVMQKYDPTVWDLFLSGAVLGMDGFFKARKGQWWDAYTQGGKSRQLFRRVKAMDTTFKDVDFGLGMYLYWRSVFTSDLWFLRMFPDRRAEGIAIVEGVARDGRFAKDLAKVNLGIMYLEERRFEDARRALAEYVSRYPDNIILRRLYGKALLSLGRFDAAIEQFRAMLAVEPALKMPHYFVGVSFVLKGDPAKFGEAERELRRFLEIKGGNYWPAYAHYWLGRLEERRGNREAAAREYGEAMKLEPKIGDASRRVRGLGGGV